MRKIIVVGAGGHAKVVIDTLLCMGIFHVIGATDRVELLGKRGSCDVEVIGDDSILEKLQAEGCVAAIGIGVSKGLGKRREIFEKLINIGFEIPAIRHPFSYVSARSEISIGTQILAGAVVQTNTRIGVNAILNTSCSIDHNCSIGNHVHIAPGAVLGGGVHLGECSFVGMGAKILPGVCVGGGVVIGGGAVVTKDIPDNVTVAGIPAKTIRMDF